MSLASTFSGLKIAGMIGGDLFDKVPVTIDFRAASLTLHRRSAFEPPAKAVRQSMLLSNDIPAVWIDIEGATFLFGLDTGFFSDLNIGPRPSVILNQEAHERHAMRTFALDMTNMQTDLSALVDAAEILGVKREHFAARWGSGAGPGFCEGKIGAVAVHEDRLTFDYLKKTLWIEPQPVETLDAMCDRLQAQYKDDLTGWTPLHEACRAGRVDVVKRLLADGANPNLCNYDGASPLLAAVDHPEVVKILLGAKADPKLATKSRDLTPLHEAAFDGELETVRLLLGAKAIADARQPSGRTALMNAVEGNYGEIVKALLQAGANADAVDSQKFSVLTYAAARSGDDILQMLLDHGVRIDVAGAAPLHVTALNNNIPALKFLIVHGAPVNGLSPDGQTPLMTAARAGQVAAMATLLEAGADPTIRSAEGKTAAQYASPGALMKLFEFEERK